MTYLELLEASARQTGNCACMGLDPQLESLPHHTGDIRSDLGRFFGELLGAIHDKGWSPAAFKPNLGYYSALDKPREGYFGGSLALVDLLALLDRKFPGIPVILDAKRGDIARSSKNYAIEAFDNWKTDAITVSPYMGTDSIEPFLQLAEGCKGAYILNRTSNSGAKELQNLTVVDEMDGETRYPLFRAVAMRIARWAEAQPGIGAVVGATSAVELSEIATYYASKRIPLLIPGVGSQGASAQATLELLRNAAYPVQLARINSSSAITHPWKTQPVPSDWLDRSLANLSGFLKETAL
ncbi:MAG: orotidine-5'-phosphate decarboxylase [Sphaerochaetaceae bacterium]